MSRLTAWLVAAPLAVALSIALQGMLLAVPLLTMHVYDGVLASRSMDTLITLAIAYVVVVVLVALLRGLRSALLATVAERAAWRLQMRGLRAGVRAAVAGDRSLGLLAVQDTGEVRRLLGGGTIADLLDLVALPAALALLFLLHPLYGWIALGGAMLLALLGALADRTTRGLVKAAGNAQARTLSDLTGRLRQPDLLDGLGMLDAVLRRWRPQQLRSLEFSDAAQRRARALLALSSFAAQMLQLAMVMAGAWLVTTHMTSPGSILAASLLAGMATAPGVRLVAAWRDWSYGVVAWQRLRGMIAASALPAPLPADAPAPAGLLAEGLTVALPGAPPDEGGRVLVRDLTLHVAPGETLAILGPNGTGKTSLLRVLLGLSLPAAGRALLDGQDTARSGRAGLGPRIGFLPQGGQILEGSAAENIARFGEGSAASLVAAARLVGAHEMIGRLPQGYASAAGPSAGLSGGQRQQLALARAFYGEPRLILLDEPEAGLDAAGRAALDAALHAARQWGAVTVLVTHQPEALAGLVDQCLHLAPGGAWRLEDLRAEGRRVERLGAAAAAPMEQNA